MKKLLSIIFISAVFSSALLLSCGKEKKIKAYVSFYTGKVTVQNGKESPVNVNLKDEVQDGDLFNVGKKSCLILQGQDGLVVRFEANTEALISAMNNVTSREITLNRGRILSSVEKLKKGGAYSVKTPTAVASVRGTQFLTSYNGKKSTVAVGRGLVSVKNTAQGGMEKLAPEGRTATAETGAKGVEIRDIDKSETLELTKVVNTPVVSGIEKKTPEELEEIFKESSEQNKKTEEQIDELRGMTQSEMKAKYGRIDIITLYNGRKIEGVILSRGKYYRILTRGGTITVEGKNVRRTGVK